MLLVYCYVKVHWCGLAGCIIGNMALGLSPMSELWAWGFRFFFLAESSYEQPFTSATQKVSSSDWQPQSKQTYSQSYSTGYGQGQTSASNSSTSYAPASSASHSSAAGTSSVQSPTSHSGQWFPLQLIFESFDLYNLISSFGKFQIF